MTCLNALHRHSSYLLLALCAALPWMQGCGGMDQKDIRKYALKRKSDDDDAPRAPAAAAPRPASAAAAPSSVPPPRPATVPGSPAVTGPSAPAAARTNAILPSASAPADPVPAPAAPSSVETANRSAGTRSTQLADTLALDPQMTVAQRRQMTLDHLQRISQALEAYAAREGSYPPRAIYSTAGQPLLSWRVHLLPQLGYESLYAQFHLDEPWDSPHNQMLAEQIPSVYQSPERCDKRTNYLLPCASTTAFHGPQVKPSRRWEDGAFSTVILVEADDALAVLWTEPRDLDFQSATPRAGLSKLRSDGFFAVFGGGRLSRIPPDVDDRTLRALFTIDGGETVSPGALGEPALAESAASTGDATTTTQTPPAIASAGTPSLAPATIIPNEKGPSETVGVRGAGQLMEQARAAAAAGLETEAIRCCYGAYLLGESGSTEWFRWVPGLRRPALAVRIGVGLDFVGASRKPIERLATPHRGSDDWPRQRAELETIVGDLGPALLSALESVPRFLPPPLTVTSTTSTTGRKSAAGPGGVTFLGVADEAVLCQVARRDFVDCLILFVVEERTPRRGQAHKSVEVRMVDAVGGRTLYSSPNVNYLRRELSLKDPLYEDPIPRVVTEFEAILVQQLQPQDMPQQLRAEHASRRVTALSRSAGDRPLAALSEMRFYQRQQLIALQELLTAYQAVVGPEVGLSLLAGLPAAQRQAISAWVQPPRLAETSAPRRVVDDPDE